MEHGRGPAFRRRASRAVALGVLIALVLVGAWFSWRTPRASVRPTMTPTPTPTASRVLPTTSPPPVLTVAQVRVEGRAADIHAYRGQAGSFCLDLTRVGELSCDLVPGPRESLRIAYANWVHLDSACCGFGLVVVGTIKPGVAEVRISLGGGRWVDATIVRPPPGFAYRFFYMEKRAGFRSLNRRLPVVALDGRGREVGRTSYLVQGG
jgi:hypothetical protein